MVTNGAAGEWRRHLAPLGVPTVVIADDPALLAAACAAYADCTEERPAAPATIELRLERAAGASPSISAAIRVEGSRLMLEGPAVAGYAEATTGRAQAQVAPALIDDPTTLAAEAIDPLLLFLLTRTGGRTPVHAAGVMRGDTALLLAGPSGSGKSTLALAAARRGCAVLSDDTVYVRPELLRVWGFPRPIHVFAKDAPPGDHVERVRAGKRKLAIPLDAGAPPFADRATLVVLRRGEALDLAPIGAEVAVAALSKLDPGFDLLTDASRAAIAALAKPGAWELTLECDPDAAIDFLLRRLPASA